MPLSAFRLRITILQITVGLLSACLQTHHPHHNFNNNKNRGHSQLPNENRRQSTQSRSSLPIRHVLTALEGLISYDYIIV